jgi:hypothetical protein
MTQPTAPTPPAVSIVNHSPKQRFMTDTKSVSAHRDMVASGTFEAGSHFAMLEYMSQLAQRANDGNTAAAMGLKLQGALEFLQIMRMLGETPRMLVQAPKNDNLAFTS